jgi:GMP synthase-like glutamine amidotransferase
LGRLRLALAATGVRVSIHDWDSVGGGKERGFDAVVLSGSYDMLSDPATKLRFARESEMAADCSVPLLGVCFGHQLIGQGGGVPVVKAPVPVKGYFRNKVVNHSPLFEGLGRTTLMYESHHEVVNELPAGFELLASSEHSRVSAMKKRGHQTFGVQFHPERSSGENPDGAILISNFIGIVSEGS